MAAGGIGNAAGFVPVADGGAPRIICGIATDNISGGVFVYGSSAANAVSSGLNSFATSDIKFSGDASGGQCNGVCLQSVGSNTSIAVVTDCMMIAVANGTVTGGNAVRVDGNNAVAVIGSFTGVITDGPGQKIGRAVTTATSGTAYHAIVDLKV